MSDEERYSRLIVNRIRNPLPEDQGEIHHVFPRCLGGWDRDNTIRLTREEHQLAHELLAEIYKDTPDAWRLRNGARIARVGYRMPKGHTPWNKNRTLTEEHRRHVSESMKRHYAQNGGRPELRNRTLSPVTREKMRQSALRRWSRARETITLSITPGTPAINEQ